jgi:ABC-type branched-subunit amino acid transport system substrate-binding protein
MINAVKLAAKTLSKKGVMGRKVSVDAQDSPCNPQVAVQAASKLVTDGVVGVVGPYCSSDAIPASTVYHRANIPMINSASTNPTLTEQGFNNVFRTIGRDDEQGAFAAKIIATKLHATKVAIVHDNSTYGKGLAEQTRSVLGKYSSVKIVYFDAITPGGKDFSASLTQLRTLSPELTYFTGYYPDGGLFLKQFVQLGVPGRFMAGDANNDSQFIKLAGSDASKALITCAPTPNLVPSAKAFVSQYKATYHTDPGAYSAYSYDATTVLAWAINKAHSTSGPAVIKALHTVKNYPGITGKITLNKKGDRVQIQYIVETVKNGQFVRANV